MKRRLIQWILAVLAILVALGVTRCRWERPAPARDYQVGAYYYLWYPNHFGHGFLRGSLDPAQEPELGLYASTNSAVIEQHIAWCSQYGIDFLAVDFWPGQRVEDAAPLAALMKARNIRDIRFCIFYETWRLGYDPELGVTTFTENATRRFLADMRQLAQTCFAHPSYLTVADRPVVILYLTRALAGPYRDAIRRCRHELRKMGVNVFLIGDEVFWDVVPATRKDPAARVSTPHPQPARVRLFDAVTAYNMYDFSRTNHAGYGARSAYVAEVAAKYREYVRALRDLRVAFVPGVFPGYNDRGVRRRSDHYAIPRQWEPGADDTSFLATAFERLALPFVDERLRMIMITSWNEWNEDTAIEPLRPAPPTCRDQSPSGAECTQGYAYAGHGTRFLEAVRDTFVAVSGRVTDANGNPLPDTLVQAWQDRRLMAGDTTDRSGYYRLSRLQLRAGPCRVGLSAEQSREIEIQPRGTTIGVDFMTAPLPRSGPEG